jgi:protein-tyrosine phosphatase
VNTPPPSGTYWVPLEHGVALAGPHPVTAPEGMEARVALLAGDVGVTHFVDLSSSWDWMPAYHDLLPPACTYTRYEIVDRRLPEDEAGLRSLLRTVIRDAGEGVIAYFHCQAGLGRTGTVVGTLLREVGMKGDEALVALGRFRDQARLHDGSPEFEAQREFIRSWRV